MPRLMIVDDEPEITAMLKRYFVREGYETVTALTGAEALRKLRCAPDMVLLDVNLPDMDGFTLCQRIREDHLFPIIMLTEADAEQDVVRGLDAGANDYIAKPLDVGSMFRTITRWVGARCAVPPRAAGRRSLSSARRARRFSSRACADATRCSPAAFCVRRCCSSTRFSSGILRSRATRPSRLRRFCMPCASTAARCRPGRRR